MSERRTAMKDEAWKWFNDHFTDDKEIVMEFGETFPDETTTFWVDKA